MEINTYKIGYVKPYTVEQLGFSGVEMKQTPGLSKGRED